MLLMLMIIMGTLGYNDYKSDGLDFRSATNQKNVGDIGHDKFHKYLAEHFYKCTPNDIWLKALQWEDTVRCFQSRADQPIDIAIIGDSHAEHLFIGLAEALPNKNIVYYIQGDLPYIGNFQYERIYSHVIADISIKTVILSAYWNAQRGRAPKGSTFEIELSKTLGILTAANKNVYIADDAPSFQFDPTACKYISRFSHKENCQKDSALFLGIRRNYFPVFETIIKENPKVKIIETTQQLCREGFCNMALNGVLFYRDSNHLNINGSKFVGRAIVDANPQLAN